MKRTFPYLFSDAAAGQGGAAAGGDGGGGGGAAAAGAGGAAAQGIGSGAAAAGGQSQQWYAGHNFDPDTQAWIEERKFGNLAEAMKAGREGSRLARDRNVLVKPDPKNPKDWEGFSDLGWTADGDKYVINPPKLSDGDIHDEAAFSTFKKVAHDARLAPWQAEAVYNAMHEASMQGLRDMRTRGASERRRLDQDLRREWGADYDANAALARRAFMHFGGSDFAETDIDAVIGSPRTVKLFQKIGAAIGEDRLVDNYAGSGRAPETVAGLQGELNRLLADPEFKKAFNDPRHPRHKDVVAQRQSLMERKANAELRARPRA